MTTTAMYTWEFHAPTGTYKNHQLSARLYEQAVADTHFVNFSDPVQGYGRGQGESITFTRVKAMTEPADPTLLEGVRIPEDEFELTTRQIGVKEIGRALPYTSLALDFSYFDITNPMQRKLMEQLRLTLDTMCATAFKTAQVKATPTSATSLTFSTNGSFGGNVASNLTVDHIAQTRDYMYDTLFARPWMGGDYVGIFRTKSIRGLKDDDAWEIWHRYLSPEMKYNSEVGRMEGTRFVETNHSQALGLHNGGNFGAGVIFGEDAVMLAEVITPELRAAMPEDYGRSRAMAWYGLLEFHITWETANPGEAKVIHFGGNN